MVQSVFKVGTVPLEGGGESSIRSLSLRLLNFNIVTVTWQSYPGIFQQNIRLWSLYMLRCQAPQNSSFKGTWFSTKDRHLKSTRTLITLLVNKTELRMQNAVDTESTLDDSQIPTSMHSWAHCFFDQNVNTFRFDKWKTPSTGFKRKYCRVYTTCQGVQSWFYIIFIRLHFSTLVCLVSYLRILPIPISWMICLWSFAVVSAAVVWSMFLLLMIVLWCCPRVVLFVFHHFIFLRLRFDPSWRFVETRFRRFNGMCFLRTTS